ncbi:MAG: transcription antitermination factor NusB [Bacillota bacterium]
MSTTREMRRHDARILALSALFCWDIAKDDPEAAFSQVADGYFEGQARYDYARELFFTAVNNAREIDRLIANASQGWPINRMPRVDLSILRLAVAEANFLAKTPYEVVIDEALELSKEFSTHASPRFVNGVLVAIFREIGHAKTTAE